MIGLLRLLSCLKAGPDFEFEIIRMCLTEHLLPAYRFQFGNQAAFGF